MKKTEKDIYECDATLRNMKSTRSYTSLGQTPFTTLGFGLGTNHFERCMQRPSGKYVWKGIVEEKRTAIFPETSFSH